MGTTIVGSPAVGTNADTRQEIFVHHPDNTLYHAWMTGLASPWWSQWERLAGPIYGNPVVGINQDRRIEVFFIGDKNELHHMWQVQPNSGWSGTASLGGNLPVDPAVITNTDGRLEVFQTGTDGTLYHAWQQKPNGGWSTWNAIDLHSLEGPPSAARNGSGQLEVFALSGGIAVHTWEDYDAGGPWRQGTDDLGSPELAANVGAGIAELGYGLFL